jgi:hypothetical protein
MKTKTLILSSLITFVLSARAQSPGEIARMQSALDAMAQTITNLQVEIKELKTHQANNTNTTVQSGKGMEFTVPTIEKPDGESQIIPHESLRDYQEAAQRPSKIALDPKYKGFIPVPNTPVFIKFNTKVKLDTMADNRNSGNPDRFVPAQIPLEGDSAHGGGSRFNVTARASSVSLDVRAPDVPGDPRFYYNNDFFGGGTSAGMGYRLKHLYGQYFNVIAGFTYSVFEDPDVWPDTVDFEGPNSMIFARQPTIRYLLPMGEHWQLNLGIQQPASEVDTFNTNSITSANHAPDGGFNLRWENKKVGHVQVGAILRDVGANSGTLGNQDVFGWGLMGAAGINMFGKDSLQAQVTYGEGYFHFANDNFTYSGFEGGDAAYTAAGRLKALPFFSAMGGYTHHWSDTFRSTASVGFNNLDNASSQGPAAYHKTFYSSVNLVYQLRKRLSVGLEALYGKKEVKNGDTGDVIRVQMGVTMALFE